RLGDGGTTRLLGFTDRILAIFPLEAEFYAKRGAKVTWVGHPLLDALKQLPDRQQARQQLGLEPDQRLLVLLPASRPQELRYLMPTLAKAAALLQKRDPSLAVMVPAGLAKFEQPLQDALDAFGVRGKVIAAQDADALKPLLWSVADLALVKSGTVNVELALQGVPQVVGYRVSRVTAFVAKHLLRFRVDHISPVNLLLNERLLPELLQDEFTPEAIV
ncbi:MAG: lipid-A-disaccharide synthase, partial [Prochlorococcus sp.]|nr:lipid-A-disaccharide synthase [Prochlorococcus sp.]